MKKEKKKENCRNVDETSTQENVKRMLYGETKSGNKIGHVWDKRVWNEMLYILILYDYNSHEGERHGGGVKTGGENVTTERVCGI